MTESSLGISYHANGGKTFTFSTISENLTITNPKTGNDESYLITGFISTIFLSVIFILFRHNKKKKLIDPFANI